MALMANNYHTSSDIPFWVQLSCAIAMGLGTSVGGWKIIKTVGGQIMKIRPVNGVAPIYHHHLLFSVQHSFTYRLVRRTLSLLLF